MKIEQSRMDSLWMAIYAELDKSEGVRINFQNDDRNDRKFIDHTGSQNDNKIKQQQQQQETIKEPIKSPDDLHNKSEECKEIKLQCGNSSVPKNINETMYTEAKSIVRTERSKRNINPGHENTLIQDQTCFQSFAVNDEEKEEELYGAEILCELNNSMIQKNLISNALFEGLHPRTKVKAAHQLDNSYFK